MISHNGRTVYFKSKALWTGTLEWPLELFLLIVEESKSLEQLKRLLVIAAPEPKSVRSKTTVRAAVAAAAAAGGKL